MARAMWKGSIAFGLVNIPIELYSAVRDHRPSLFCEAPRPVFLDVLPPGAVSLEEIASRWQLFSSAAELAGAPI